MQWDVLINPIVGGVIGYATNYLAIKMLFKPHNAKHIGKFKIPFTPGLIPKEKATLAHQMGKITEEYLLTEDMLVETLTDQKAEDVFFKLTSKIPQGVEGSNKTIGDLANSLLGEEVEVSVNKLIDHFTLEIIRMLKSKELIDQAVAYLTEQLSERSNHYITRKISDKSITLSVQKFGAQALESEKVKTKLYGAIDDVEQKAYVLLQDHAVHIGKGIIAAIGQGEEATKIKDTIKHWTDENVNQMVSMFLNIDKIYDKIINFANEALADPERSSKFGDLLCTVMKDLIESEPGYKDTIIDLAKNQMNEVNVDFLIEAIIDKLSQEEENIKVQIEKLIVSEWNRYIDQEEFLLLIKKMLKKAVRSIGDVSVTSLGKLMPKEIQKKLNEKTFNYYKKTVEDNSKQVAELLDISLIVENKINEFSSQEAEDVILSVVREQLRGITWIGALLGTIIGVVSNLIR